MAHRVLIVTDAQRGRVRAECACTWSSPWTTAGPAWPDSAPRPMAAVHAVAERAAGVHVRAVATPAGRLT